MLDKHQSQDDTNDYSIFENTKKYSILILKNGIKSIEYYL
jgi:hypothetical protein